MRPPDAAAPATAVSLRAVGKRFPVGGAEFVALSNVDVTIAPGEFVAIAGPSGSGKSTLLHLLAGIERPSEGTVSVGGQALERMSERELSAWRGRAVGVVFQFFQLLPTLTSLENVMLPMDFAGAIPSGERRTRALALLERLGVADQADKLPAALSGGQQQRVAVARALVGQPSILLADEPTGNLDSRNGEAVMDLLRELHRAGSTICMVTHDQRFTRYAERAIHLFDGRVVDEQAERPLEAEPAGVV